MDPPLPPRPRPPSPPRAYTPTTQFPPQRHFQLKSAQPHSAPASPHPDSPGLQPLLTVPTARPRPPTPPKIRPPRLPARTQLERAPLAHYQSDADSHDDPTTLPSYNDLAEAEPSNLRFGRWSGWVVKRARERQLDSEELMSAASVIPPSRWDLDVNDAAAVEAASDAHLRQEDTQTSSYAHVHDSQSGPSSYNAPAQLGKRDSPNRHRAQNLTVHSILRPLGSRFARGLPERPRCAVPLGTHRVDGVITDRFILIGTDEGLYLADLFPSLSAGTLQTSPSTTFDDLTIVPVWTGLAVLQIDVFIESEDRSTKDGVVFALVRPQAIAAGQDVGASGSQDTEIRMWPLSAIDNLARWRATSESSSPLQLSDMVSLRFRVNSSGTKSGNNSPTKHRKTHSSSAEASADDSDASKRSSKGFFQSIYDSGRALTGQGRGKGKERDATFDRGDELIVGRDSLDTDSVVTSPVGSRHRPHHDPNLELPLEWATSYVNLPLPRSHHHGRLHAHGSSTHLPLFYKLVRVPFVNGVAEKQDRLVLMVATKTVVYVLESKPAQKRTWQLLHELYAPATPQTLGLVRVQYDPQILRQGSTSRPGRRSSDLRELDVPRDLAVFLGMSNKAVLIRLADTSVQEIRSTKASRFDQQSQASTQRTHSSSLSTSINPSDHRSSRARSRSSVSASSASSAAAAAVVAKVSALVEGKSAIPVGMRSDDMHKTLSIGRKLDDLSIAAPAMSASSSAGSGTGTGRGTGSALMTTSRWVDCAPLVIASSFGPVQFWLVTQGQSTQVWPSPLMTHLSTRDEEAITPVPLHVFEWSSALAPVTRVMPLLRERTAATTHDPASLILVLAAFTTSGVCVQEGLIDISPSAHAFFTPLSRFESTQSPAISLKGSQHGGIEDAELGGTATLDYSREVQVLGLGGPRSISFEMNALNIDFDDDDDQHEGNRTSARLLQQNQTSKQAGVYFAVQAHSDWSLMWLGMHRV